MGGPACHFSESQTALIDPPNIPATCYSPLSSPSTSNIIISTNQGQGRRGEVSDILNNIHCQRFNFHQSVLSVVLIHVAAGEPWEGFDCCVMRSVGTRNSQTPQWPSHQARLQHLCRQEVDLSGGPSHTFPTPASRRHGARSKQSPDLICLTLHPPLHRPQYQPNQNIFSPLRWLGQCEGCAPRDIYL